MEDPINETWGPFQVRCWKNEGWWEATVQDRPTGTTKFWASSRSHAVTLAALDCALQTMSKERGLRLRWWREKRCQVTT